MVAFLLTYALHSTPLLGAGVVLTSLLRAPALHDTLLKAALIGGVLTAAFQLALPRGSFSTPLPTALTQSTRSSTPDASIRPEIPTQPGPQPAPGTARAHAVSLDPPGVLKPLLLGAWGVGAAFFSVRLLFAWLELRRTLRGRREHTGPLRDVLGDLLAKAGTHGNVRLTVSPTLGSPVAYGREICVPAWTLSGLSAGEQRAMLAHELAHLLRHDPRWLLVSALVKTLFFFQPLNVVAARRLERAAEYLCDDLAVTLTGDGPALARCLTEVARRRGRPPTLVLGMARYPLSERVKRILEDKVKRRFRVQRVLLTVGLLGGVGLVPGVAQPDQETRSRELDSVEQSSAVPYTSTASADLLTRWVTVTRGVIFNDDFTRIERILPTRVTARVIAEERQGPAVRKVVVTSGRRGLNYAYTVQRKPVPFDQEARAWFEGMLLEAVAVPNLRYERGKAQDGWLRLSSAHSWDDDPSGTLDRFTSLLIYGEGSLPNEVKRTYEEGFEPTLEFHAADALQAAHQRAHGLVTDAKLEAFLGYLQSLDPDVLPFREMLYTAEELESDDVKARFLTGVAPRLPKSRKVEEAYMEAASTIAAPELRQQAVSALQTP